MKFYSGKKSLRNLSFVTLVILVTALFWLGTKTQWISLFAINPPADKIVHSVVFGFIAALLWFYLLTPRPAMVFMIALTLGAADEMHQLYIPGRTASFADFAADLAGAALIVIILKYTQQKSPILSLKN
jgi:VanZ like family